MSGDLPELFVPPDHRRVLRALEGRRGRANVISQSGLAQATGLGQRRVRRIIYELIVDLGQQICSTYGGAGQAGYFLPATPAEAAQAAQALREHALAMLRRASVLERRRLDWQIRDLFTLAGERDAAPHG